MNSLLKLAVVLSITLALGSCQGSEYEQLVKRELASGVRNDSLMFGIYFGDSLKEFYGKCWELNKEGIISHGPRNMYVQYTMRNVNGSDVAMLFYPSVDAEDKIKKMKVEFFYTAWSPWNEQYEADKLVPVAIDTLEKWYPGNPFMDVVVEQDTFWVKVDGNRRITLKTEGKQNVIVRMVDMLNKEN